jgi:hypothetical protein
MLEVTEYGIVAEGMTGLKRRKIYFECLPCEV